MIVHCKCEKIWSEKQDIRNWVDSTHNYCRESKWLCSTLQITKNKFIDQRKIYSRHISITLIKYSM